MERLKVKLHLSERRLCRVIGQPRSTQRHRPKVKDDEEALAEAIIKLATRFGRYGYRPITALLEWAGWRVNHKRVERIWRREGFKVPKKQPKRGRLWLNGGSCVRLRPTHLNHVWSYDFVMDMTHEGRAIKILIVIDEFTRECLALVVDRRLRSDDVLFCLAGLFLEHGIPDHIRSDNGSAGSGSRCFSSNRGALGRMDIDSFNGKLRDEKLKGEIFYTLKEAQVLIERWRVEYNTLRPQSSLEYRPPAPEAIQGVPPGWEDMAPPWLKTNRSLTLELVH